VTRKRDELTQLVEHCIDKGLPEPRFYNEKSGGGFRVWVVMSKERMELPTTWEHLNDGEEKLSKQILKRLKAA
jgi:hypothetical protein